MGLKSSQNLVVSRKRVIKIERKFTLGQFLKKTETVMGGLGVWRTEILISILVMLRCSLHEGGYVVAERSLINLSTSK